VLLAVERGGVIFKVLDEGAGLRALIEDLGFAFIDATALVHLCLSLVVVCVTSNLSQFNAEGELR
jgi:hypothetical protein